jgi:hypothetical protein
MTIAEVKAVFNESAYKLGVRDCKVMSISATNGYVTGVGRWVFSVGRSW